MNWQDAFISAVQRQHDGHALRLGSWWGTCEWASCRHNQATYCAATGVDGLKELLEAIAVEADYKAHAHRWSRKDHWALWKNPALLGG